MNRSGDKQLFSKQATNWFRGIAAIMVVLSHYAEWWTWFTPTEGNVEMIRYACSKLGVYGVDIFFLFSGYAMVKSLKQERMQPEFVWKRIKNVYIPYFIVVGIIEMLAGGFTSLEDFWLFASGYDYWYMFVLFILYIGFIAVWTIMGGREVRLITFVIFTYAFSYVLYSKGMHDFWYVSNITFALGVIAASYEEALKKTINKIGIPLLAVLAVGMIFAVRSGLGMGAVQGDRTAEQLIGQEIGATVVWTVLIMILAAKWRYHDPVLTFLGKNSLYIYLIHTYVFMRCVNNFEFSFAGRFAAAAVITILVAALFNWIITALFTFGGGKGKTRKTV